MRNIDRLTVENHQIPSIQLMRNAAAACFLEIKKCFSENLAGKKALILCGQGNNGGDGAALAQEFLRAGVAADVILFGRVQDSRGDARTNFEAAERGSSPTVREGVASGAAAGSLSLSLVECNSVSEWERITGSQGSYDVIVDSLFGTGLSRPLEGVFHSVIEHLRRIQLGRAGRSKSPLIVSVDIPSGLNADVPNTIGPAVQADLTVTFTAPKAANVLPPASDFNGKLVVADIGSPRELVESVESDLFVIEKDDVRNWLLRTRYTPGSFKNTHGHVLVIAGSRGYTGAAVLCGNAAMRSGAGLVTIATPASAQPSVAATAMAEVMTTPLAETDRGAVSDDAIDHVKRLVRKASVVAIGPGLSSEDDRTRRFAYSVVKQRKTPMVIDADALNCLAPWPVDLPGSPEAPLILTPHPGEMLRLLGTDDKSALDDRVAVARDFATKHNLIVVLKGARALVAVPGRVFINSTGSPGLGTAGSGDTLTGIIAGFIAQAVATLKDEADVLQATIAALYVGGLAGDFAARKLGMRAMVASDIREHLSEAICSLDPEGERPRGNLY
jgi:ADP-dependent NAD(P)H-hydrate dehydratase / NAD(P)H-hydrate epimerase